MVEVDPYADLGGRTLSELEHDIRERWARPDRDTILAVLRRLRAAEAYVEALDKSRAGESGDDAAEDALRAALRGTP